MIHKFTTISSVFAGFVLLAVAFVPLSGAKPESPVAIVFDTDMGNDIDDAMALAMIHSLQSRGHCELLAITLTKDHPQAGPFCDAFNTFYGRGDIPIATVRDGVKFHGDFFGHFIPLVDAVTASGKPALPHDLGSGEDAPESVEFLRRLLASREDQSVVLVQVGFFTNYARLLRSEPDDISPLSGRDLIERKVKWLSVMAGAFEPVRGNSHYLEFNVKLDIPSAQVLAEGWPTSIVWSGFEIGIASTYPAESIEQDFEYTSFHPLKEAYCAFKPPPHNRPTWDLSSVLVAIWPNRGYFGFSEPGNVVVEDDGYTRFTPTEDGRDRFLTLTPEQSIRLVEAYVQLCSQPPGSGSTID